MVRPVGQLNISEVQRLLGEWVMTAEAHRLRSVELEASVPSNVPEVQTVLANSKELLKKVK